MAQKPLVHKTLDTYLIKVKLRQDEGIRACNGPGQEATSLRRGNLKRPWPHLRG